MSGAHSGCVYPGRNFYTRARSRLGVLLFVGRCVAIRICPNNRHLPLSSVERRKLKDEPERSIIAPFLFQVKAEFCPMGDGRRGKLSQKTFPGKGGMVRADP